jgi:hypothetical protein
MDNREYSMKMNEEKHETKKQENKNTREPKKNTTYAL